MSSSSSKKADLKAIGKNFVKSFAKNVISVASAQCGSPSLLLPVSRAKPIESKIGSLAIGARLSFTCKEVSGDLYLFFPEPVYCTLMSGMLMFEISTIDDETADGVKELLNIIFGSMKTQLQDEGIQLEMAIPTLIKKEQLADHFSASSAAVILPFESQGGPFYGKVKLKKRHAA